MQKEILVLNGAPRKNGNTDALVRAFVEGAESAGHIVHNFRLAGMNLKPCIGCRAGGKNPDHPCVQKDDMEIIYPLYKKADVVVLASPLYYWIPSGHLKIAVERLYAVSECNPNRTNPPKECVLLTTSRSERLSTILSWYQNFSEYAGWTDLGKVLATGTANPGDIENTPFLEEARKLGASIG